MIRAEGGNSWHGGSDPASIWLNLLDTSACPMISPARVRAFLGRRPRTFLPRENSPAYKDEEGTRCVTRLRKPGAPVCKETQKGGEKGHRKHPQRVGASVKHL